LHDVYNDAGTAQSLEEGNVTSATWRRCRGAERGSVLVGGMMLVFLITLVGSGVFTATVLENRMARNNTRQTQAWYFAQAGLNAAKLELEDGDGTNDFASVFTAGTSVTLFANKQVGAGSFTVTAQPVTGSSPNSVTVTSTGCVPASNPCLASSE